MEYHPNSGRPISTLPFEDFGNHVEVEPPCVPNSQPWHPWRTCTDFEIATLSLECHMNEDQTTKLMSILDCVVSGRDEFTLKDYKEIQTTWDLAAEQSTKVCIFDIHDYELTIFFHSSRQQTLLYPTEMKKWNHTSCIIAPYGTGYKSFCWIVLWYHKWNGMHVDSSSLMAKLTHGNGS